MTPIFNALHDKMFPEQCEECNRNGWPRGTFICANDDITCFNY